MPLQAGVELNFGKAVSLALLGEARGGFGYPYFLEGGAGGMAELYFLNKFIGIGMGYGFSIMGLPLFESETPGEEPAVKSAYMRLAFILRGPGSGKASFYADRYANGGWGFGIQYSWDMLRDL